MTAEESAPADDIYLPPSQTNGARYCLNPASATLREIITRGTIGADERFDARALANDVATLHALLRKQYAGYPELLQHRTFDVEAFFRRWLDALHAHDGSITFEQGVVRYLVELNQVHPDRHLMPRGWGTRLAAMDELAVAEYQAIGDVEDIAACVVAGEVDLIRHTLRKSTLVRASGAREPIISATLRGTRAATVPLRCGDVTLELTRRDELPAPPSRERPVYQWESIGDVALIKVRHLNGSSDDQRLLQQFVEDYEAHRKHRTIVFDFRDNGGGSDGYVMRWVEQAKNGSWSYCPVLEVEGVFSPCREWNAAVYSHIDYGEVDSQAAQDRRQELRDQWPPDVPGNPHRVYSGTLENHGEQPFDGHIVVLINRFSASSGESGPKFLQRALGAVLVGERSAGYLEYGNVHPVVLPHTKSIFWIPTTRFFHDPPAEVVGLAVDYYLDVSLMRKPARDLLPLLVDLRRPGERS